jgi:hypothetical protein
MDSCSTTCTAIHTYVVVWGPDADDVGVAAVHSDVVRCRTTAAGVKLVTEETTITATAIVGRKYMVMVDSVCESHNNVRSMAHSLHLIETRTQLCRAGTDSPRMYRHSFTGPNRSIFE